jgi:hypothetical protein
VALLDYYDTFDEPPREPLSESVRAMIAGLEKAAIEAPLIFPTQGKRSIPETALDVEQMQGLEARARELFPQRRTE